MRLVAKSRRHSAVGKTSITLQCGWDESLARTVPYRGELRTYGAVGVTATPLLCVRGESHSAIRRGIMLLK